MQPWASAQMPMLLCRQGAPCSRPGRFSRAAQLNSASLPALWPMQLGLSIDWYLSKMQTSGSARSRTAVSCCSLFGGQTEVLHPASSSRRVCSLGAEELQGSFLVSRLI